MTKLVIQIPCYNEAQTLPQTIADLPSSVDGFDEVEILVIDDGSEDGTRSIAKKLGVQNIIRNERNRGLAYAFYFGLQTCLAMGADVIVNTDGDNQYRGEFIKDLVKPINDGTADIVIGDRKVETIPHFSRTKKLLQRLGSWIVRLTSGTRVSDATSGFRAFSREAALRLVVYSNYTYTLETIIQAGKKGLIVESVPVATNPQSRESRLIRSVPQYVLASVITIVRVLLMYEAITIFLGLGSIPFLFGLVLLSRFGWFFINGQGQGHIQSLIIASILILIGFLTFLLGLIADLIARNRQINEDIGYLLRKAEYRRVDSNEIRPNP